eukprot:Skav226597  [mRNA]  locus=scaffold5607:36526:38596:+ [translate_table: standard]
MANQAEQLSREVKIKYRTSTNLILRDGTLFYNEEMQTVEVETSDSDESMKVVKLSCLCAVEGNGLHRRNSGELRFDPPPEAGSSRGRRLADQRCRAA